MLAASTAALAAAGSAAAFQALPPSTQVNDDAAAGISAAAGVSGEDPANSDVVGGALVAGKPAVPWAVFRAHEPSSAKDQIFSRSFAGGVWKTRGTGTVGGRSDSGRTFAGSLNFDQAQDGEAPSIDFAGVNRVVPWATWYENTSGFGIGGVNQVFASRFDNTGDANQDKWLFGGQGRGLAGGTVPVPSLNIRTDQSAENPSIAGGSATDPTKPGPWVTWQETTTLPVNGADQIFVSRPVGPGSANCDTVTPAGVPDLTGHVPAVNGFCWQETGIGRVGPGFPTAPSDPSLNVDPRRDGIEPDIAFTGPNDSVPWVVWYEKGTGTPGLQTNELVFAAKGVADPTAIGGFKWTVVGTQASGTLDTTGTIPNAFGACAASAIAEQQCSLNKNAGKDAEDPQVAAGTMNPASPTAPWVAWDETDANGVTQILVARLVLTPTPHFEAVNSGAPISIGSNPSTRPDITFSGNTPYVSWKEDIGGGVTKGFFGHFINPSNPAFVLDESDVPLTPTGTGAGQADVREPISSTCTANPFNKDGSLCQGAAIGTPFFLFTSGTSPLGLFADAYQPTTPVTGPASAITDSTANVAGSVNPQGAPVSVSFQYGRDTSYGSSTTPQTLGPDDTVDSFTGQLTGLPASTVIHYRAVATSDFGTLTGPDQTLTTAAAPVPTPTPTPTPSPDGKVAVGHATVSGSTATLRISCTGDSVSTCRLTLQLTVIETLAGHRLVAESARVKHTRKTVSVGSASVTLAAGQSKTVKVSLNSTGKRLLARFHRLKVRLTVTQKRTNAAPLVVSRQTLTFKQKRGRHHH
jgi:hypothetical protein